MKKQLAIYPEPVDAVYDALLDFALKKGGTFSLVWRDQFDFDEKAAALEVRLRPHLVGQQVTDEWPGTRLIGHRAIVRHYSFSDISRRILGEVRGLFAWQAPSLPEDLAFYDSQGNAWLGSIAHERDAFVDPDFIDVHELQTSLPSLWRRTFLLSSRGRPYGLQSR